MLPRYPRTRKSSFSSNPQPQVIYRLLCEDPPNDADEYLHKLRVLNSELRFDSEIMEALHPVVKGVDRYAFSIG